LPCGHDFRSRRFRIIANLEKTGHTADPIRAIEAVTVRGVPAGTIISRGRRSRTDHGRHPAGCGAIGVACSFGFYSIAVLATAQYRAGMAAEPVGENKSGRITVANDQARADSVWPSTAGIRRSAMRMGLMRRRAVG
jgi:hypothetical protein